MRGTIASQGWTVKFILVRGNKRGGVKKGGQIFILDKEESKDRIGNLSKVKIMTPTVCFILYLIILLPVLSLAVYAVDYTEDNSERDSAFPFYVLLQVLL